MAEMDKARLEQIKAKCEAARGGIGRLLDSLHTCEPSQDKEYDELYESVDEAIAYIATLTAKLEGAEKRAEAAKINPTVYVRRIDDLGRIQIPKGMRDALAIDEGDALEFGTISGEAIVIYHHVSERADDLPLIGESGPDQSGQSGEDEN